MHVLDSHYILDAGVSLAELDSTGVLIVSLTSEHPAKMPKATSNAIPATHLTREKSFIEPSQVSGGVE